MAELMRRFLSVLGLLLALCCAGVRPAEAYPAQRAAALGGSACAVVALDFTSNPGQGRYCLRGAVYNSFSVVPGLTSSRASTGYALNSAGTLALFGSGVLRITDLGVLDELSATNLALQSQTLNNWNVTNVTVSADQIAAPDGTLTADLLTVTSATGNHSVVQPSTITVTTATAYTASFYARAGTSTHVGTDFKSTNAAEGRASFVLSGAGTANVGLGTSASVTILALANGWYYCTLTATVGSASELPTLNVLDASGSFSFTGAGEGAYFWGEQFELGSAASSYIVTTAATVTRAADALTLTYSPAGSAATVSYGTNSTASVSPTSPINLGSSSGGAWVGNYIRKLVVTP